MKNSTLPTLPKGFSRWAFPVLLACTLSFGGHTYSQINYTENFDLNDGGWLKAGGYNTGDFANIWWDQNFCTAAGAIRMNCYGTGTTSNGSFTSPSVGLSNQGQITLNYQYKIQAYAGAPTSSATAADFGTIDVQYSDSQSGPWITVQTIGGSGEAHVPSQSCATKTVNFVPTLPASTDLYIRFAFTRTNYDWVVYIDDVSVSQGPPVTCMPPGNLTVDVLDPDSADFTWTEPGTATLWNIEYGESGFTQGTGSTISGLTSTNYQFTGLMPDTTYDVYLQSDCGGGDQSPWQSASFSTPILAFAIEASGFNADVIANGVGTMASSTNNDVDGVNYCFVSEDWKLSASDPDINGGLPEDGLIVSSAVNGLTFQMSPFATPYDGNNSLRINGTGTGTLTLPSPANYETLYFLVTSGSGSSTTSVTVNFADSSSETFSNISVPDWFQTGSIPVEVQGFGRGNLNNNNFEANATNPKLFRITTDLDSANYAKAVSSVTFSNSGNVLNVFAISGKTAETCMTPGGLSLDDLTDVSVDFSWSGNFTETDGYNWVLMAPGDDPDTDTPLQNGSTASGITDVSISGLTTETSYDFYVQTDCGTEESHWAGPFNFETLEVCPAPGNVQLDDVSDSTAEFSWDATFNESNGYNWVVMTLGDDPDTDTPVESGTTVTGVTSVLVTGLSLETEYDFYVQTDCGTNGESSRAGPVYFETTNLCPPPTGLQLDNAAAASAEVSWTISNGETDGYHWALMAGGDNPNTDTPLQNGITTPGATSIILAGLSPQTSYDFYLQSDCGVDGISLWSAPLNISTTSVTYCTPSYSPTGASWRISNFAVPEISFSHNQPNYIPQDQTAQVVAVDAGDTYTFEITTTGWTGAGAAVDFNYNGTFEDTDEILVIPTYIANNPQTYVSSVTIPAYVQTGDYRLRLWNALANSGDGTPPLSPCGSYAYGAYIDFTLSVTNNQVEGCQSPLVFTVTPQAIDTAEVSWNSSPDESAGYNWALMLPGQHPDTDTPIQDGSTATGVTSVVITNLDENTDYIIFVQTDCDPEGESFWASTTFLLESEGTTCENPIEVTALPYTHTDDTENYLNNYSGSPGSGCGSSDNYLNGNNVVYQYSPVTDITLNIDLSDLNGFYAAVFVYASCSDIGNNCIAGAVNGPTNSNFGIADLELTGGQDYYIVVSSWLSPTVGYTLDIIESTCPEPSNLQAYNVLNTDAEVSWNASMNEQNGYEWAVMTAGQHPDTHTPYDTNQTATSVTDVQLSGLVPGGNYDFYVRTDCDLDGLSGWAGPVSFQTIDPNGDIPTSPVSFDSNCNGPAYTKTFSLPATGGPWEVTGIDIEYAMTAANGAYMSEQQSLIHFQNTGTDEPGGSFTGVGLGGTYQYNRTNVNVANGTYVDGEELIFEMRAWRTWSSAGQATCTTYNNKVDAGTWNITVHYQPAPTCPPVTDLTVTSPNDDEMEVSWTDLGPATSWNIEYGPTGFTPGTGTIVVSPGSPELISGLAGGIEYDVYVQGDCGPGDLADWEGPITVGVGIPSETYNDGHIPTGDGSFDISCNGPGTTLSIFLPSSGGPWEVIGFDVEYTMTAANGAYMSEQRSAIYSQNSGNIEPWYSGSGLGGTFAYDRSNVDIANGYYPDGEELIFEMRAWRTWSSFGQNGCLTHNNQVNDGSWSITVFYQPAPTCLPVQNLVAQNTAPGELEVSWNEIGTATTYNLEYGLEGFTPGTGTLVAGVSSPYNITGLDMNLDYHIYVQGDCGGGDLAAWVGPVSDSSGMFCETAINIWDLPYATQDSTGNYGNYYSGAPGTDCGTGSNYLDQNDVVYHFVPDEDMEIDILLTGLNANYAGIFIYEDCTDIGSNCLEGAFNGFGTGDLNIGSFEVSEGQSYYILISGWLNATDNYTLIVNRVCATVPALPTGDEEQSLCMGYTLQDLAVVGNNIRWYASNTALMPLSPLTELIDGFTYYASQAIDGCESDRLAVTVTLMQASELPDMPTNHTYENGETLDDLDIPVDNPTWYADAEGTQELPGTTLLEDQTTYYLSETEPGYCESPLLAITVYETVTVSVPGVLFEDITYFPNPAAHSLTITNSVAIDAVTIYALTGQKVLSQTIGLDRVSLDVSGLSGGVYLLEVLIDGKVGMYRIIKE